MGNIKKVVVNYKKLYCIYKNLKTAIFANLHLKLEFIDINSGTANFL